MSSRHIRGNLVFRGTLEKTGSGDVAAADLTNISVILVNKTSGAATGITLPAMQYTGQAVLIVDAKGDAATNNITITPASGNINGSGTYVISENYGSVCLVWDGTNFTVFATANPVSAAELAVLNGVTAGTSTASKVLTLDSNSELNGIGVIKKADVIIPTGEVLALNGTPKTIVAAPGSGKYLEFLGAYVFLDYNSAAYVDDAGEDLVFKYTNGSGAEISQTMDGSAFDGTADALVYARPAAPAADTVEVVENAAIVLHLLTGEWITGDSPLKVRCYYREVRKAALEAIA